mmetsp:Transcript_88262/g.258003  ORF Transcript_88262/g.258003 Transcript_88262/m.258003 type:complete len:273 (+) Transcript_88262:950-1768(+)
MRLRGPFLTILFSLLSCFPAASIRLFVAISFHALPSDLVMLLSTKTSSKPLFTAISTAVSRCFLILVTSPSGSEVFVCVWSRETSEASFCQSMFLSIIFAVMAAWLSLIFWIQFRSCQSILPVLTYSLISSKASVPSECGSRSARKVSCWVSARLAVSLRSCLASSIHALESALLARVKASLPPKSWLPVSSEGVPSTPLKTSSSVAAASNSESESKSYCACNASPTVTSATTWTIADMSSPASAAVPPGASSASIRHALQNAIATATASSR